MILKESEAKKIFQKYGIAIPDGILVSDVNEIAQYLECLKSDDLIVKAQVLSGSRGKRGLILSAAKENVAEKAKELLGKEVDGEKIEQVLIEEKIPAEKELFLSLTIDKAEKSVILLFSEQGGVDIEELTEKIIKVPIEKYKEEIKDEKLIPLIEAMHKLMKELDAELVEINPLVLVEGKLIAADAKIRIDDNSLFRHPEFEEKKSGLETKAKEAGLNYVELEGNIAVIGNGAGLVMATLDILANFGGKPANFLDVGGGASVEKMEKALEIALLKPDVKGIFINIFGGITRCDEIAEGIVNYTKKNKISIPIVVRMIGTNEAKGKDILSKAKIHCLASMEECAKKIGELVK
jgi:succinyl-CoA synthetase beta subunit